MAHFDLLIIGTGSGNSVITPAFDDKTVALVERDRLGGTCLNVGCIPSKMLVIPADRMVEAHEATAKLGVDIEARAAHWPEIRDRVFGRIDPIEAGGRAYRERLPNVTVYAETARFAAVADGDPLQVTTDSGATISADRWVIAAGGRPRMPDVDGLRVADPDRGVHTSDTIMRLDTLPRSVAIIGGGVIGAEFAHILTAFGVAVTWLSRRTCLLGHADSTICERFTALSREEYDVRTGVQVRAAERRDGQWHLSTTGAPVTAEAVLVAIGREPNTDELDCRAAGIALTRSGVVAVDQYQRSVTRPEVWALGDIAGDFDLKHVANHEARIVAHNLTHPDALEPSDHRAVPYAVFGHPQIASVGATEQALRAAGIGYRVAVQAYGDTAYGWALEDRTSICKILLAAHDDTILGAHLMGPQAPTLIQPLIQAISFGLGAERMARGQYWIHPGLPEVVENALLGALAADPVEPTG